MDYTIEASTLKFRDGSVPEVTIYGRKLAIVSLAYSWATRTDASLGISKLVVTGYVEGDLHARTYSVDYRSGAVTEIMEDEEENQKD